MNERSVVPILLCEPEIDEVDDVRFADGSHEKVVGLNISVEETSRVDVLDSLNHLIGEHQHRLH